ncbi:MAG TPA: xanthine dehydrogenase family protein subunit M [Gemmatimonadaceae bacterium]
MIPAAFEYTRASSLTEALDAIGAGAPPTKLICGGQTLVPILRFRLAQPHRLVDIGQLPELRGVTVTDDVVRIGAATTYRELLASEPLREAVPLIAEVTENIGDLQVRNLGTIGGALAHADPSADMPAAMLALDARFHLQSARATRTVAAREFFRGPFETALKADELLVAIELQPLSDFTGSAYVTFEQAASGYALVGAAAVVTVSPARGVTAASLAFTGLADTPFLADVSSLLGSAGDAQSVARAAAESVRGVSANADIHADAAYRLQIAQVGARRALSSAITRAQQVT